MCVQTDTILRNYAESMRAVTATINFQVIGNILLSFFLVYALVHNELDI